MIEPLISLMLFEPGRIFRAGDELNCEFQIDAVEKSELTGVEASVLWYTEGKGDEDRGIHYFERRTPADAVGQDLRQLHQIKTTLPNSPLTYDGYIVKIRWCVRVRAFFRRGKEVFFERPFQLGDVLKPKSQFSKSDVGPETEGPLDAEE